MCLRSDAFVPFDNSTFQLYYNLPVLVIAIVKSIMSNSDAVLFYYRRAPPILFTTKHFISFVWVTSPPAHPLAMAIGNMIFCAVHAD